MARDELTIAVVGGGFGGTYFLKELERLRGFIDRPLNVLLFEPRERFVFTPLLHELATAGLDREQVTLPYHRLFDGKEWLTHLPERVERIDTGKRRLLTPNGAYAYDYLLLATGATTNFFGKKGAEKQALTLKDEEDALGLRLSLEQALIEAARARDPAEQRRLLTVAVVGGGATGVELAPEILQFLRHRVRKQYPMIDKGAPQVLLFQGAAHLLPAASRRMREQARLVLERAGVVIRVNSKVTHVGKGCLIAETNGEERSVNSALVIWVAGIAPSTVSGAGVKGYLVKEDLSLFNDERSFAIGDAACYHESCALEPTPALAQVAVQEARIAARNMVARINGRETRPFRFQSKGFLVSLGQREAAGELRTPFGTLFLTGFPAWWLWRTIYLFKFLDARQRVNSLLAWTTRLFTKRSLAPTAFTKKA